MLIKHCTGPFSWDVISRLIWFMVHKVDLMTLRSYAYKAVYWSFLITWRHVKFHLIYGWKGRLWNTDKLALSSSHLPDMRPHHVIHASGIIATGLELEVGLETLPMWPVTVFLSRGSLSFPRVALTLPFRPAAIPHEIQKAILRWHHQFSIQNIAHILTEQFRPISMQDKLKCQYQFLEFILGWHKVDATMWCTELGVLKSKIFPISLHRSMWLSQLLARQNWPLHGTFPGTLRVRQAIK